MMKNKTNTFYLVIATILLFFYSCDKVSQHDFDNLRDEVARNTEEISTLKDLTTSLQEAIDNGQLITKVEEVTKTENGETISGIKVTFSGNGGVKTIWNGATGTNGNDGSDGNDGANGKTPFVWVNTNGNWAVSYDKIPIDKDNASYEMKDTNGESIPARGEDGFKIEVINQNGFIAFKVTNPNTNAETITATTIPFDPKAKIVQGVVQNDFNVVFTVDGKDYKLMREVNYPTSITMLAKTALVQKGKTTSFNVKVNPSNALFTKEMLSIGYVPTMTRASSVIVDPDFVKLASCKAVDATSTKSGEYTITLEWMKDIPDDDRALFIIASTKNNLDEDIEITSSTPIFLTEEFIPIKPEFINDFSAISMFQGETYTDEITLTKSADGIYLWDKGYISATSITMNPTANIAANIAADDKFTFNIVADIVPAVTTSANFTSQITVKDINAPTPGTVNKTIPVTVYPLVSKLITKTIPNNWIPVIRKNNYANFNFAQELTDAGFVSTVWDIAATSAEYFLNGTKTSLPSSIVLYPAAIGATKDVKVDILPEILAGAHKIQYTITATAKEGKRHQSLPQTKTFTIEVEFTIKAPVFHITLNPAIVPGNDEGSFALVGTRGTFTTIINKEVAATDVFEVRNCVNHSDSYKTEYNIADNSPAYAYAPGSGAQGLMFRTFPVSVNWNATSTVEVYSKLATGQEIPVYIDNYVTTTGGGTHASSADAGIININFRKLPLDHVATMPYKTPTQACFNYTALQPEGVSFNINDEYTILGKDVTNKTLHSSCITSVQYEVLDNASTVIGMPKKLLVISETGVVKAALNHTWDTQVTVSQPIKITMTDIWGNSKSATVGVLLNSNSVPTRPIP